MQSAPERLADETKLTWTQPIKQTRTTTLMTLPRPNYPAKAQPSANPRELQVLQCLLMSQHRPVGPSVHGANPPPSVHKQIMAARWCPSLFPTSTTQADGRLSLPILHIRLWSPWSSTITPQRTKSNCVSWVLNKAQTRFSTSHRKHTSFSVPCG